MGNNYAQLKTQFEQQCGPYSQYTYCCSKPENNSGDRANDLKTSKYLGYDSDYKTDTGLKNSKSESDFSYRGQMKETYPTQVNNLFNK